ncbi:MAG: 50S ribosomal protein L19 [bacterium]
MKIEGIEKGVIKKLPKFNAGDEVEVSLKIKEGDKERIQHFTGIVIAKRGEGVGKTFTVRKISYGIGIERIFPLHSPVIAKIKVKKRGRVRRAKLYYLKERKGKRALEVKTYK